MDITSKIIERECEDCKAVYQHEELTWNGTIVACANVCDSCNTKREDEHHRKERENKARAAWEKAVPQIYRSTDIAHPDYRRQIGIHNICLRWVKGEGISGEEKRLFLGLIGDSGVCKTRIVSQMVKLMIWRGNSVFWANSSQFQWACQNLHNDNDRIHAAQCLNSCRECPVLVLDDIGSLKASETVSDHLYAILEHRAGQNKPMIWTSNETFDEMLPGSRISEKAKKRNISRLAGYSDVITL